MAPLFFSQHLSEKLDDLRRAPLSVIEGPAGYGKTTSVHRALDGTDSDVFWYTAVKETADSSFSWFVHHLEDADTYAPAKLRSLGSLNRSNARTAAEIIRDIRARKRDLSCHRQFPVCPGGLAAADNRQPRQAPT